MLRLQLLLLLLLLTLPLKLVHQMLILLLRRQLRGGKLPLRMQRLSVPITGGGPIRICNCLFESPGIVNHRG
jgi:hypothetical protein